MHIKSEDSFFFEHFEKKFNTFWRWFPVHIIIKMTEDEEIRLWLIYSSFHNRNNSSHENQNNFVNFELAELSLVSIQIFAKL